VALKVPKLLTKSEKSSENRSRKAKRRSPGADPLEALLDVRGEVADKGESQHDASGQNWPPRRVAPLLEEGAGRCRAHLGAEDQEQERGEHEDDTAKGRRTEVRYRLHNDRPSSRPRMPRSCRSGR
jgi:hypothetical protein